MMEMLHHHARTMLYLKPETEEQLLKTESAYEFYRILSTAPWYPLSNRESE